jgi:hypothetical protein
MSGISDETDTYPTGRLCCGSVIRKYYPMVITPDQQVLRCRSYPIKLRFVRPLRIVHRFYSPILLFDDKLMCPTKHLSRGTVPKWSSNMSDTVYDLALLIDWNFLAL